jgi:hypothetical protein
MRIVVLITASLLVAGCSQAVGGQSHPTEPSVSAPSSTTGASASTTPSNAPTPPPPDTPIAGVIAWIEAGNRVDAAGFHSATRAGTTTQLGDDVAFTTPSGKTTCMTDSKHAAGALSCLVKLTAPPPKPDSASPGPWIGGWVEFDGASLTVGGVHGDPGPFTNGDGPQLAYRDSLSFGDFRCRTDPVGLYCVNYAHQSAARLSEAGIAAYACAKQITPPPDIGEKWVC